MEETYTLACKFKDTKNKTCSIMINNPTEDLSDDKIKDFMNCVIDDLDPDLKYASVLGAELTTKIVEEIDLA